MSDFILNMKAIQERARKHLDQGAVTAGNKSNRETVLRLLNESLATELVCVLRYKRHAQMAEGLNAESAKAEFEEHAGEEAEHADWLATRITQLEGEPNYNPEGLAQRSHSQYVEGKNIVEMLKEDLVAERIAIEVYSEIARYIGEDDPTTRRLIEKILEKEEEHAEDLSSLLAAHAS
jgi:bacterioferritin